MRTVIVTGSGGLIGSESVAHFVEAGFDVVGLENDMRAAFFGPDASTAHPTDVLADRYPEQFRTLEIDIRDAEGVQRVFAKHASEIELVIRTAAQPSHDWAASDPQTDFGVNANGTLNLLEATRAHAPDATFIFCSTNNVYGDLPNSLPLVALEKRLLKRFLEGCRMTPARAHVYWNGTFSDAEKRALVCSPNPGALAAILEELSLAG